MSDGQRGLFPASLSLDTLNEDVIRIIAGELCREGGSLRNLASSSHSLRDFCLPILFSRCKADVRTPERGDPPEEVRVHARHLTHLGPLGKEQDMEHFEALLERLPSLQSVAIKDTSGHVPWRIWKACCSRSRIKALSYDAGQHDLAVSPFPSDEVEATPIALQKFSYTTTVWREWFNDTELVEYAEPRTINMRPVFEFERECLSAIVMRMSETATSLTLPLESTPVLAMAELSWPNLKELNLHGRFLDAVQATHVRHLLPSLPSLAHLSILAARPLKMGRPPFVPSPSSFFPLDNQSYTPPLRAVSLSDTTPSPEPILQHLQVLEVAFPDPRDGLFSIPMPMLYRLSLRDYPRTYHMYATCRGIAQGPMEKPWSSPYPCAREALSILKRMEPLPLLRSLEIVYGARSSDPDDELLSYIVEAFPRLEYLEIHRYRNNWHELTRYTPIARILSRARSLRTVRLNLDFRNDPQAYCSNRRHRDRWLQKLREKIGPKIVKITQACASLEHVAILYHGSPSSVWVEFHPSRVRGVEPRFVMSYDDAHVESEMIKRLGGRDLVF